MRSLFWLLAVFAAAVALVVVGRLDAGYVVAVVPPWRIEASLKIAADMVDATKWSHERMVEAVSQFLLDRVDKPRQ